MLSITFDQHLTSRSRRNQAPDVKLTSDYCNSLLVNSSGDGADDGGGSDVRNSPVEICLQNHRRRDTPSRLAVDGQADTELYTELRYRLHIRRRSFYFAFNVIVPCLMLSVLTLLTFWLPATSNEKVSLGLSVFLTYSMFMLLMAEEVPTTSESVPLIGESRNRYVLIKTKRKHWNYFKVK